LTYARRSPGVPHHFRERRSCLKAAQASNQDRHAGRKFFRLPLNLITITYHFWPEGGQSPHLILIWISKWISKEPIANLGLQIRSRAEQSPHLWISKLNSGFQIAISNCKMASRPIFNEDAVMKP
jgi:hypothetical protein